ncbi:MULTISPECIES: dUTP diphosphatase [Fusobacterium]|uniref:dUTP diphosphatase n=1 Tax=Fusobacterium TaxID=848 RepID=UPI000482B9DF|nr:MULTISPECIES: dUTP diphosphatase [Fusobacterium]MCI6151544.1 dUTP diphosphatase [Fusobacterium perfoetens]MDY3237202.1 dUTP diphosphatase [Fusobacterium perfoetens]NME35544.1 dUTP diphosphatase [Fusobacterium sp. FSA-380-WT-3A]
MEKIIVKVILEEGVEKPVYMTEGSAGMDVRANIKEPITLKSLDRVLVPTGIKMEIPLGYEVQVRPRSGLALKHGITLVNSPGTIDSDYRGEIGIIMANIGREDFVINPGERIAQLVLGKVYQMDLVEGELSETERGAGGFGHTGK